MNIFLHKMSIFKMRPVWATVIEYLNHCDLSQLRLVNRWFAKFKNTKKQIAEPYFDRENYKFYKNSHPSCYFVVKYQLMSNKNLNFNACTKHLDNLVEFSIENKNYEAFIRLVTFFEIDYEFAFKIACERNDKIFLEFIYSKIKNKDISDEYCRRCYFRHIKDHFDEEGRVF